MSFIEMTGNDGLNLEPGRCPVVGQKGLKLEFRLLCIHADREQIEQIWRQMTLNSDVDYFLSSGWVETWLESLPRDVDVKLVVGSLDDSPVLAFFAGYRRSRRNFVIPVKSIFVNATGVREIDRLSIEYNELLMKGVSPKVVWEILNQLDEALGWDEVVFPGFAASSVTESLIKDCPTQWQALILRDDPSPYVDLEKVRRNNGDYAGLLSGNTRRQMRRCYEAYAKTGPIRLESAADVGEALDIFNELVSLHQDHWKSKGVRDAFSHEYSVAFHNALIRRRFDAGEIQLLRVTAGGRTVGCLYNFVFNDRVLFYQSGLLYGDDPRFKPGWLCHSEAAMHNARNNLQAYDYLAGRGRYKRSLSTDQNRMIWIKIQKRKLRFRVESAAVRAKRIFHGIWQATRGAFRRR